MDILYIIGRNCSLCNYNELRYSLRSIEKHGANVGRVYVAGYCPDFLSDKVIKVPFEQPYQYNPVENDLSLAQKYCNILSTLLYVIDNTDISDEFLISMDDHIYVRNVDFDNYPYYVKKFGADNKLPKVGNTEYRKTLAKTRAILEEQKLSYYYLTLHRNMHCSKRIISECREFLDSALANQLPVEPIVYLLNYQFTKYGFKITPAKDVKLLNGGDWWKTDPRNTEVFSTADFRSGTGLDILIKELFNYKSKYEND